MKTLFDETMEIITPCFCAGADQTNAEIRAPSIRGELRWWFRALGGTREQESRIFGSIEAKDKNKRVLTENQASALVVRVSDQKSGPPIRVPSMKPDTPLSYLLYFANASGKARGVQYGPRFQANGMLSPGSTFHLQLVLRKPISEQDCILLSESVDLLLRLGTIGYRGRRACGAWCGESIDFETFKEWSKTVSKINIAWPIQNGRLLIFSDWFAAMCESEHQLREFRRSGNSARESTPLGKDSPRQASAVRFRPVKLTEGFLPVVVYTDYALSDGSLDPAFNIGGKVIGETILSSK